MRATNEEAHPSVEFSIGQLLRVFDKKALNPGNGKSTLPAQSQKLTLQKVRDAKGLPRLNCSTKCVGQPR